MLNHVEVTEVLVGFWSKHGIKVIERVFGKQLRNVIRIDEMLMGFVHGRVTIDAVFKLKWIFKKCKMAETKFYVVLEKAFESVIEREVLAVTKIY